ncbi:hypothetical protein B0A48_02260 [Cryoendolithus antarcticus]|uniref:Uncharacterized protein n=1 Tax=Cryoendolithus antarcticus TaxID=1507870 RepID=A0A1V8TN52_9PEZI|nr:hypothetical protein B0A48_02260 [Cryoendolithus antarcticus]
MKTFSFLSLSNELIRMILDQIEPDPDKTVPVDRRQFLSVESFDFPPPSSRGSIRDIGQFRLTCRRFSAIGAPLQFTRVSGRLSQRGLQQLEVLAGWPHVAQHVKKFSYMVPYFYDDAQNLPALGDAFETQFGTFDVTRFQEKVQEQRQIVESQYDVQVLQKAIGSFTSLQHVQLLRVQDEEDRAILRYVQQHADADALIHLEWAKACSHGSQTIGAALLVSKAPWSRFSSPMLSPQSAEFLSSAQPRSLSTLAERLTCLTLHFDDGTDLDSKMSELSSLFQTVFTSAKNMQAVHVGFPSHRPLTLPLEDVFHNVTWDKLVAFGVQGWKLNADEILGLALRHRDRLKGLRLRDVQLREGNMWKDVLSELRHSMSRLEWVSLRRIGYARSFDESWLAAGAEVLDDEPPGESESDSSEEDYIPVAGPSNATILQGSAGASSSDESESEGDSETDDEHGPDAHELDFPPLDSPITPASATWCNCNGKAYSDSVENLGDNGFTVSNAQRRPSRPTEEQIASGHNILPDLRDGRPDTSGRHGYTKLPPWKSPIPDGQLKPPGSNYSRTLVLARTKAENTSWVDTELSDMLSSGLLTTAIYVADDPTAPLHPPRNKGHEAMIYLSYIIDHYDTLPDFSIFMHGHQFAWHNNEILDTDAAQMIMHLSPERVMRLGYMDLRCHWEPGCPAWLHPGVRERLSWKQEEHLIADSWAQVFPKDPIPAILAQPCCAQFAVSRERILATPKQRYVYLRDWLLRTELSDYLSGRVFEYIWQYVFTSSPSHCPSMSECYCDGYGFCFGSPEAFDYWFELQYKLNEAKNELQLWWKKADMIEEVKLRSPTGKVAQEADLDIPRVGRDEELEEEIKKIWAEMKRRKNAAYELGRNPAQRALEAGRTWRDGDGF